LVGLPLGDNRLHSQAVMVNILGDVWKNNAEPAWDKIFARPELKLHLYGKHEPRPGRKMGHFTVIGEDQVQVIASAIKARDELGIG
jgi:5-(carboxyamino)imidazole ribonucleotide synthase